MTVSNNVNSPANTVLIPIALAIGGGYGDAGGYILAKSFTGHITGNTVLAAASLVHGDRSAILIPLRAIGGFIAATAAGVWLTGVIDTLSHALSIALIAESALALFAPVGLLRHSSYASLQLTLTLCLALGLQNGAYRKVLGVGLHTNYMTGDVTTLLTSLIHQKDDNGQSSQRIVTISRIWIGFALGALLAGIALRHFGVTAIWFLELPLGFAAFLAWRLPHPTSSLTMTELISKEDA